MAKVMKKNLKKQASTKKIEPLPELMPAPPIEIGMISVAITEADLVIFANLMTIVTKTFEDLAIKAAGENDMQSFRVLQSRCQLSSAFASRLADCVKMPEPISRDMH